MHLRNKQDKIQQSLNIDLKIFKHCCISTIIRVSKRRVIVKRLDIDDLYLIRTIAQEASLSAVASKLGVTGSSITRRIKKIEALIDSPLIRKTPGNLALTEAGEKFLNLSSEVLRKYDLFQIEADKIKSGKTLIRIIGNASIMSADLPEILSALTLKYPEILLELQTGNIREIFSAILSGDADVGIVPDSPKVSGLIFHKYRKERICAITQPEHPLTSLASLKLSDIAPYRLIGTSEQRFISTLLASAAKKRHLKLNYLAIASDYDLQARMAASIAGTVAITFECVALRLGKQTNIRIIQLEEDWAERSFYLCLPKNEEERSPPVSAFVDRLLSQFRKT